MDGFYGVTKHPAWVGHEDGRSHCGRYKRRIIGDGKEQGAGERVKCCDCPQYEIGYMFNHCKLTDNECFETLENCKLVNDDGTVREELLPCPFCGSEAKLVGECDMVWAKCANYDCEAERGGRFDEPEDAIKFWNRRVSACAKN